MAAITVTNVTRQFGTQIVLENVSLSLHTGETVGLVGANGSGKTTLFRLITGEITPDLGTITRARGLAIGFLPQEPDLDLNRTLHDEVGRAFTELLALEAKLHEASEAMAAATDPDRLSELMEEYERINARFIAAGGHGFEARLNEILGGLGFTQTDHEMPLHQLSGGQRCRAALGRLLLEERPMLLLDEPTNHLDIDAVRWLEKFLAGHHGGAVIISHDRYLLDRLCDRIVEVANREVSSFPGNYSNYVQVRELRRLTQERQLEKDRTFIEKERAFIAKHLAGQRTAEAKGRRTRLERRLKAGEFVTEAPIERRSARISFESGTAAGGPVLRCDELSMHFDNKPLFSDLNFQLSAGERLGITGPNGTGKTTLLNILLGKQAPTAGKVSLEQAVSIGYYAQEPRALDPARSVIDEVRAVSSDIDEQQARNYLARFLFRGDDVFKPLGVLSGGEQSRVRLATLILSRPQLLVLDEPTNHLDIPSREVLEEALVDFGGTILTVSHDRYFLDRVVQRMLVIRPEGWTLCTGNYSTYEAELEARKAADRSGAARTKTEKRKARKAATGDATRKAPSPYDRLSIEELEARLMEKEEELAALHERYADPAVCRDPDLLAELEEQVEEVEAERTAIDSAWQQRVAGLDG